MRSSIPIRASSSALAGALFLLILAPSASFSAAKEDFVIYEAQSRPAEELKKAAEGLMTGARISLLGQKIIVYGGKAHRDAVLKLFGELDHKLTNFVVSVRAAGEATGRNDAHAVEGGVAVGGVGAAKKSCVLRHRGGGTLGVRGEAGEVRVTAESEENQGLGKSGQQISVVDGGNGRIYGGSGLFPSSVIVNVRSLGKVGARVEIRQADIDSTGEHKLVTEVNVVLGEWTSVGGGHRAESGSRGELLGKAERSETSARDVQIKVEREAR